jgi:hypothetical protein
LTGDRAVRVEREDAEPRCMRSGVAVAAPVVAPLVREQLAGLAPVVGGEGVFVDYVRCVHVDIVGHG